MLLSEVSFAQLLLAGSAPALLSSDRRVYATRLDFSPLARLYGCLRRLSGCVALGGTVRASLSGVVSISSPTSWEVTSQHCWGPLHCGLSPGLGPFRLTRLSSAFMLVGRPPTLHSPLMDTQSSE